MKVPFFNYPDVYKKHRSALIKIIDNVGNRGAFIMQNDLKNFEKKIAKYSNCNYAIGVGNATDALEMLLFASNVQKDDEVIICTHTMIATASAISVIATDVGGAREMITDTVNGHLVPPQDPEALAEKLRHCVTYAEERKMIGLQGKRRFDAQFTATHMAQQYCHMV